MRTCKIISPLHDSYDMTKLCIITREMESLGSPRIRAVFDGEIYRAIEGSHRLAVAHGLSLFPEIIEVEWDDVISDHDIADLPTACTVRDIIEYAGNQKPYDFSVPGDYWFT